jgi:hypothetical protein
MSSLSLIFLKVMGPLEANADNISLHICNFDLFKISTLSSKTKMSILDYVYRDYEFSIMIQNQGLSADIDF